MNKIDESNVADCTLDSVVGKDSNFFGLKNNGKEICKTEVSVIKESKVKDLDEKRPLLYRKIALIALVARIIAVFKTCGIAFCAWNWPYYGVVAVVELLGFCSNRNLLKRLMYMFMFSLVIAIGCRIYFVAVLAEFNSQKNIYIQIVWGLLILSIGLDCAQFTLSTIICYCISKYTRTAVVQIVEYSSKVFKYF